MRQRLTRSSTFVLAALLPRRRPCRPDDERFHRGRARFASGAVPGVTVTLIQPAWGPARGDHAGHRVLHLPAGAAGTYTLRASLEGFKTSSEPNVVLNATTTECGIVTLEVGALAETVSVTSRYRAQDTERGARLRARREVLQDRAVNSPANWRSSVSQRS